MTGRGPDPSELGDILSRHSSQRECVELCPICRAADILRGAGTEDLRDGWQDVQREALLTMKAVIDRYVERLDDEPPGERRPRVEDIPID